MFLPYSEKNKTISNKKISIKACHDNIKIYFLIQYSTNKESQIYIKMDSGKYAWFSKYFGDYSGIKLPCFYNRIPTGSVVDMLQPLADQKKIKLSLTLKEKEITILADRRLIRQALINLLNNALKFTKKGYVEITVYIKKEDIVVDIKDSGIGIEENDLKLIFKDFHRAEKGLTSNYEGVGLGLVLTKRIIELHKGCITVESKFKKGSTFTITLPIVN